MRMICLQPPLKNAGRLGELSLWRAASPPPHSPVSRARDLTDWSVQPVRLCGPVLWTTISFSGGLYDKCDWWNRCFFLCLFCCYLKTLLLKGVLSIPSKKKELQVTVLCWLNDLILKLDECFVTFALRCCCPFALWCSLQWNIWNAEFGSIVTYRVEEYVYMNCLWVVLPQSTWKAWHQTSLSLDH